MTGAKKLLKAGLAALAAAGAASCTPRIEVVAPTEPITINLNIKIEHEVRVRIERGLDDLVKGNPDIF